MSIFNYKNKLDRPISFDFGIDSMIINEMGIGNIPREIKFKYSDIIDYRIVPNAHGYFTLSFYANDKVIEVKEDGKVTNESYITVTVKVIMNDSALSYNTKNFDDGENSIRKVIYNNTPLRSELDKRADKANEIYNLYKETPDDKFGIVYLTGPKKELDNYTISINNVGVLVAYTTKTQQKLIEAGQYYEHPAKLTWVNDNTLAFRIPYGNWNIGYSVSTYVNPLSESDMRVTAGPQKVDIVVNDMHKEVKLKLKLGLFQNKLVEI